MQDLIYRDNSLDLSDCEKYSLSIRASLDGFSFFMRHHESRSVAEIWHIPYNLSDQGGLIRKSSEILEKHNLQARIFRHVTVYLPGTQLSLIPDGLFVEKNVKQILTHGTQLGRSQTALTAAIDANYRLTWLCQANMEQLFRDSFPACSLSHICIPLIRQIIADHASQSRLMHCHTEKNELIILFFKEGNIHYLNSFTVKGLSDMAYFMIAFLRNMNEENADIGISGSKDYSALAEIVKKSVPGARPYRFQCKDPAVTGLNQEMITHLEPILTDYP
jgi:hypothetical protein